MDELIKKHIDLAIKHGELILTGDSKKANRIHKNLMDLIDKIYNDTSIHELFYDLFNHENISVRIWVAIELSNTYKEKALDTLKEIEKMDSILGLTAKSTIDMIQKGMIEKNNWKDI